MEKGKFPKQVTEMALSRALPASLCTCRERLQGCRSSLNPLPKQSCSKSLCFSFTFLTQCPGFHQAQSFIYLNRQAVSLNSCS